TCLQALTDLSCVSVEQVEAWANGGGGDDPRNLPEACDVLEDIRVRCHDDADSRYPPEPRLSLDGSEHPKVREPHANGQFPRRAARCRGIVRENLLVPRERSCESVRRERAA